MAASKDTEGWKPGDPDRRKRERSLLELTGTEREEHRPSDHPLRDERRAAGGRKTDGN